MVFKKTYTVDVEIDLDAAGNDPEWAVENWECSDLGDLTVQMYHDIDEFIKQED